MTSLLSLKVFVLRCVKIACECISGYSAKRAFGAMTENSFDHVILYEIISIHCFNL